jgi:nitrilase
VVLERLPRGPGVVVAGVDLKRVRSLRRSLPALTHRTLSRC